MAAQIEAVLFDLGNVLTLFSHDRMVDQMAAACGVSPAELRVEYIDGGVSASFERGLLSPDELVSWARTTFECAVTPDALRIACADIFTPNVGMGSLLDAIRAHRPSVRLVVISNTCCWHVDWVSTHDTVLSRFDAIATSWEVGELKPHPALYQRAIELAGVAASKCFYTDDIPAYVAAGAALGLDAEIFVDNATLSDHLRARDLLPGA